MSAFRYVGSDSAGAVHAGSVESGTLEGASSSLRSRGVLSVEMSGVDDGAARAPKEAVGIDAFTYFNRAWGEMTVCGIPASDAIRRISQDLRHGRLRESLDRVEARLRQGTSLEEAFRGEGGGAIPGAYHAMVGAGVASGNLPHVLFSVARQSSMAVRLKQTLFYALLYPAVVIGLGAILLGTMVVFVLPAYRAMYLEQGFDLPSVLVTTTSYLSAFLLPPLAFLALVLLAAYAGWRALKIPFGEFYIFRIPWLGTIPRGFRLIRFLDCLEVLLKVGCPLHRAALVSADASGSPRLHQDRESIERHLRDGGRLCEVPGLAPLLGEEGTQSLAMAESSGRLPGAVASLRDLALARMTEAGEMLGIILLPVAVFLVGIVMSFVVVALAAPYTMLLQRMVDWCA